MSQRSIHISAKSKFLSVEEDVSEDSAVKRLGEIRQAYTTVRNRHKDDFNETDTKTILTKPTL